MFVNQLHGVFFRGNDSNKINMLSRLPFILFSGILLLLHTTVASANPDIQTWNTKNGARVYYVHAPELPIVDMRAVFDAGSARDAGRSGLALMTNGLLSEGAAGLNANQIAERFESIGAQFSNGSYRDMASVELRTLSEKKIFDVAVQMFSDIINRPDFPSNAFAREQSRLLLSIQQRKQSPDALAEEAFFKAVFGKHPYSSETAGSEDTVSAITVEDLKNFYQEYYVGNNVVFAIVGDINRTDAEALANKVVGQLPAGQAAEKLPPVSPLSSGREIRISHPSTQTHILMGQPGMHRGDPDYYALYVGNHILGGSGLTARLSNEVREKRGLAYSTYSYFSPMRVNGPYTIGAQTKNESATETLMVLRDTLDKFVTEGPSPEELEASKKNITGGFPLRISSNKKILDYIAMIGFYQLPLDYLDTFNNRINSVAIEDIKNAFQTRISTGKMVTVMVGGSQTAEAGGR